VRIAYFTDTYAPEVNGVTNTLTKLMGYLAREGVEFLIFAPDYAKKEEREGFVAQSAKGIYRFRGRNMKIAPNSCLAFPRYEEISALCSHFKPDLIHVVTEFGIGRIGVKYAKANHLPLVMSYHTDYCKYLDFYHLSLFVPAAESYLRQYYKNADRILVPSKHTRNSLLTKGYKKIGIWSRGIDKDRFDTKYRKEEVREALNIRNKFAFLYVGRINPEKGLDLLLYAIERMNREYKGRAAFVFAGDGTYREVIEQYGFDNVIMTGFQKGEKLSEIYASCDCFAFPSATETFGNAALEAMASGLPVVAMNSGGVTEFLISGQNSLLCETGEREKEEFYERLVEIMEKKALREYLRQGALKTAGARSWEDIFEGLLSEYEEVIVSHSGLRSDRTAFGSRISIRQVEVKVKQRLLQRSCDSKRVAEMRQS